MRHGVEQQYGLSILHRHFDLDPEEQLVEYQNVSAPWKLPKQLPDIGGDLRPKAWTLSDEIVRPLEYGYYDSRSVDKPSAPPETVFLDDLRDALVTHGLESHYGLSLLPDDAHDETKPVMLEFTAGRTNIMVPLPEETFQRLAKTLYLFPCIDPLVDSEFRGPRMRHCYVCTRH